MSEALLIQGRRLEPEDLERIRALLRTHPEWSRRRLSQALCAQWEWRNGAGRWKDMAARSLLLKLQARGLLELPARRQTATNRMRAACRAQPDWDMTPVVGALAELEPLEVREVSRKGAARATFAAALARFHYLGYRGSVGENLQYTVHDAAGRWLACLLFGAAAWKCQARDRFIGWTPQQRTARLHLLANNSRFLILPWVHVPHLASRVLGQVGRRLGPDWQRKYGHGLALVETFVERPRFAGTSYRAANWIPIGSTTGRTRQDPHRTLQVPRKDVYLLPLRKNFRAELSA
ncbi:MAG TPA: Druantia anti-phage system protein DruA [Anaerolineales bacterium]|nr:Druantia anti-phage system protein DruA [Anaerolineales bacterium]